MNVSRSKLDQWVDQSEPTPQREQELIAAWLNLPMREIFTDIAPPIPPKTLSGEKPKENTNEINGAPGQGGEQPSSEENPLENS